jgi:AAA15 family ATPase/GTPase
MIIQISVSNFRSIKNKFTFSMEAESGQSKSDNLFHLQLANESPLRLLKSAVIYGANASGKTNFIRSVFTITNFILNSLDQKADDPIDYYDPFLLDPAAKTKPCEFEIFFVLPFENKNVKHRYAFKFNGSSVLSEELDFFPRGQTHNLFRRELEGDGKNIHTGKLGQLFGNKKLSIFHNQLILSKFGKDIPNPVLTEIYLYFTTIEVWNALDSMRISRLQSEIANDILQDNHLLRRLNKLLKIADTRIESINVSEVPETDFRFPENFPDKLRSEIIAKNKIQISANHKVYTENKESGVADLPLWEESAGTNVLFALGGVILKRLGKGGVIFFDELDNSLHPRLSKFLVRLFNNPISNPKNTQLIVATHEVTLLDKEVFRKDQIWFSEKDKYGVTDLFSAKEVDGVRDETPFDKWYMNGKFGGQPKIKEVEFIFDNE